jgi:short-subunit dehydrogenase
MKLAGSTILITGANGGIGAAIARELARRNASLILTGRNGPQLEALAAELRGRTSAASAMAVRVIETDLGKPGAAQRLVAEALRIAGTIDAVVNCAGIQNFGFFSDESPEDTERLFRINTLAPIALINAVLPHMLGRRAGHLVNVGSIFGSIGFPCFASYSASKFALRGFSEALRRELFGSGISVAYVAPRFTKTALNGSAATRMANALRMNQDEPRDVARKVIAQIERGGADRYLGWPEKLFVRINSIFPRLVDRALAKQVGQMRPFAAERAL